jgi:hypothetical protein
VPNRGCEVGQNGYGGQKGLEKCRRFTQLSPHAPDNFFLLLKANVSEILVAEHERTSLSGCGASMSLSGQGRVQRPTKKSKLVQTLGGELGQLHAMDSESHSTPTQNTTARSCMRTHSVPT